MSIDSKSHARAVILAGTLSATAVPPSIPEAGLRVPGIHMVVELHVPPLGVLMAVHGRWRRCAHLRQRP